MREPSKKRKKRASLSEGDLLNGITNRIRQSLELPEILSATTAEIQSFLKIDRVKVYQFQEDGTGIVIAESVRRNRLPSLMGLHFPATDIPPQAREMYIKARTRTIVDVAQEQITLNHPPGNTTAALSLEELETESIEDIVKRPVDPCHVNYLTAMGVKSSLVVPVVHQQKLWGLVAAHHAKSKHFSAKQVRIVQMSANQLSVAIAQSDLLSQARLQAHREALINEISTLLHAPLNIKQTLQKVLSKIVNSVAGSGGRLYILPIDAGATAELFSIGSQPLSNQELDWLENQPCWKALLGSPQNSLEEAFKQSENNQLPCSTFLENELQPVNFSQTIFESLKVIDDIYQSPELQPVWSSFESTKIRGLLLMPLLYGPYFLGCLTIFRNEIDTNIIWAGRFEKDERNQPVRASFAAWQELKYGQVDPWINNDIELIQALGNHVAMAVMQNRLFLWEREHRLLVEMRNQELKTARATAEEASRIKSDFLSSTSHELRTPLAATINYLKLLKEEFYDNEAELKEYIAIAYQSAENLVAIINDVLDIAKIEAGRTNVNYELIDLSLMLEELQRLFRVDSQRKGIPLIIDCPIQEIWGDKIKLRQVLTNLLSNAFKFTTEGEIRVQVSQVFRKFSNSNRQQSTIEISVIDTGIGIEPSQQMMVFEPFVQADGSIKRRYGGTGLGLTVCKRLVELMNGEICLESNGFNQGTRVSFTLPFPQLRR